MRGVVSGTTVGRRFQGFGIFWLKWSVGLHNLVIVDSMSMTFFPS